MVLLRDYVCHPFKMLLYYRTELVELSQFGPYECYKFSPVKETL